jgi:hypothetical protein
MYTTTQLLFLLAALSGVGAHAPPAAQSRNEIASTVRVSAHAAANGAPITAVDDKSTSQAFRGRQWRKTSPDSN